MAKQIIVTCDCCQKDISHEDYNTVAIRRYNRKSVVSVTYNRLDAVWLCDDCFSKLAKVLKIKPFYSDSTRENE